ncbi:MAG TPA: redoxin family protein [Candidatus Acidoferrum sp.]|jgi:thiol-disulfide isomerase/thioredoxin
MRTTFLWVVIAMTLAGTSCARAAAADAAAVPDTSKAPVCEASAATRHALHEMSSRPTYTVEERREYLKAIDGLLAKNPDDVFLHLDYISTTIRENKAETEAVIERYKGLMEKHPASREYEFLYATTLVDTNTPEAITRFKAVPAGAPIAPQAQLRLTKIYEFGKFADQAEASKQLDGYLAACPASINSTAREYADRVGTAEMAEKYAKELRVRLRGQKDPTLLVAWETVWNMEFMATPAKQDEIRSRMKGDLQTLRGIRSNDLGVLSMLQSGYKMAGDKKSEREIEDRIIAEYPDSGEAEFAESQRFQDQHPYPKQEASAETKQTFYRTLLSDADAELQKNPKKGEALRDRFEALEVLDGVSNEDIVTAGEALRTSLKGEERWYSTPPMQFSIARAYIDRNIRVEEVPDLIAEGRADFERRRERDVSDRETDELKKIYKLNDEAVLLAEAELSLDAARLLEKPEIARPIVEKVLAENIDNKYLQVQAWEIKGKWAELSGKKLDALLMYRASLDSRVVGYKARGKKDDAKEGYERLWKELGGTDSGADAWLVAAAGSKKASEGGWERVSKELPDAKLTDLNGKTWSLSELKGKTVLINIWATWCGPCQGEHPYLQALYDKVKDRKDIAVISMSVDDSIGDVEPYMKEKKYSFPVLLASRYVNGLTPALGVPQNWIVGADGRWEWLQEGFAPDEWEKRVMEKLEGKEGAGKK